jgi:hypothetical protein
VFAIPFLVVLAQDAFVRAGHAEPYPALMMPAFPGTRTAADGSIGVGSVEIAARFRDGATSPLPMRTLLDPMPSATMMTVVEWALRCQPPVASETRQWLRTRLDALYPLKHTTGVDVRWFNDSYRVDDGVLRRAAHVPTDECTIDMAP